MVRGGILCSKSGLALQSVHDSDACVSASGTRENQDCLIPFQCCFQGLDHGLATQALRQLKQSQAAWAESKRQCQNGVER
eukprot:674860-Amphidinium_carterae.1